MIPEERAFFGYFAKDKIDEGLSYLENYLPLYMRARYKAEMNRNGWFGETFDEDTTTSFYKDAAELGDQISMVEHGIFTNEWMFVNQFGADIRNRSTLYALGVLFSINFGTKNKAINCFKKAANDYGCLGSMHELLQYGVDTEFYASKLLQAGYFFAYPDIATHFGQRGDFYETMKLWKRLIPYRHGESCYKPIRYLMNSGMWKKDAIMWMFNVENDKRPVPEDISLWFNHISRVSMSPVDLYLLASIRNQTMALTLPGWNRIENTKKVWNSTIAERIVTFIGVLRRKFRYLGRDMRNLMARHIWIQRLEILKLDDGCNESLRIPKLVLPPLQNTRNAIVI